MKFKSPVLIIIFILLVFGLSISFQSILAAWTSPTLTPPTGNIDEPLNKSNTLQIKLGGLYVNSGNNSYSPSASFAVPYGNVGIGTVAPLSTLGITGNASIGATYGVLAAPTSGLIVEGNVGIGTTNPGAKLTIQKDEAASATSGTGTTLRFNGNAGAGNPWEIYRDNNVTGNLIFAESQSGTRSNVMSLGLTTGNVGIGTAAPGYKLDVAGTIRAQGDIIADANYGLGLVGVYSSTRYQNVYAMGAAYRLPADGTTSGNLYGIAWTHSNVGGQSIAGLGHQALFMSNGITQTAIGTGIYTVGNATIAGAAYAASYNCTSDKRLKKDITAIDNPLSRLTSINGVYYNWKDETKGKGKQVGVISQDVEKVLPEIVGVTPDGYKTVDYSRLSPLIIEAVKELDKKNEDYANNTDKEIEILKDQIKLLQQKIESFEKMNKN